MIRMCASKVNALFLTASIFQRISCRAAAFSFAKNKNTFSFVAIRTRTTTTSVLANPPLLMCQMTARSPQFSQGGFLDLPDGQTSLPYLKQSSSINMIVAHGLGTEPPTKTHLNDIAHDLWRDCCNELECSLTPGSSLESEKANKKQGTAVLYTARGHGLSHGWDEVAKERTHDERNDSEAADVADLKLAETFLWPALAKDMAAVADATFGEGKKGNPHEQFCIFGQSMGAMTAIYYTIQQDPKSDRVKALILARPPRIWENRQIVADMYIQAAMEYKDIYPNTYHHLPILGAFITDLPNSEDERWTRHLSSTNIPVLLLCHGDDATHPVESGTLLKGVIPNATLHDTAIDEAHARQIWPKIIADWLLEQGIV